MFDGSILENITYGSNRRRRGPNESNGAAVVMDEVEEAARLAHADDFIRQMAHGYHTVVGEKGVQLSGGQRQRISIGKKHSGRSCVCYVG